MFLFARWVGRWGVLLALAMMLTSQVALAQQGPASRRTSARGKAPPKVAVLAFEGDRRDRVRGQVEGALRRAKGVKLLSLKQYMAAAAKEGLTGAAAREPTTLPVVAPRLALDAAVTGTVGRTVQVRVLDANGRQVLSRELPLRRGQLTPAQARSLAADIATAASAPEPEPTPEPPPTPAPVVEAPIPTPEPLPTTPPAQQTPQPGVGTPRELGPQVTRPDPREQPATGPTLPPEVDDETHTTTEPAADSGTPEPRRSGPPVLRLTLGGTTTWRRYCARPGVASCREFDVKPEEEQAGDTANFKTSVPHLGVGLEVELLPLARTGTFLRGLGLVVGLQRGYATVTEEITTPSGDTPGRDLMATDTSVTALGMYRYYFGRGTGEAPLLGYAGLRGGFIGRAFNVDATERSSLSGTHRFHPVVGLEVSVPLARTLRIEGAGHYYFNPTPGQWAWEESGVDLEVRDLGEAVTSSGWSAELGVAGEFWGPLGYSVRFRLMNYADSFTGRGVRTGWTAGGVAEETYSTLQWGLTASW